MSRRIHLHINSLTLDGIDPGNRDRIAAEIERELVRQLGAPGATQRVAAAKFERIDGGRIGRHDIGTAIGARIGEIVTRGAGP